MKNIAGILKDINKKKISAKEDRYYITSGFLRTIYNTDEDFAKTAKLFDTAQKKLEGINFNYKIFTSKLLMISAMAINNCSVNFDEVTENMKQIVNEMNLRGSLGSWATVKDTN